MSSTTWARLVWSSVVVLSLSVLSIRTINIKDFIPTLLADSMGVAFVVPYFERAGPLQCPRPSYTARVISFDPLMIHLENFITAEERKHLIDVA
jgi:hypothetical protein